MLTSVKGKSGGKEEIIYFSCCSSSPTDRLLPQAQMMLLAGCLTSGQTRYLHKCGVGKAGAGQGPVMCGMCMLV